MTTPPKPARIFISYSHDSDEHDQRALEPAGHADWVTAVAVTLDGKHAVSASSSEIKVWDLASGQELRPLSGHSNAVAALTVTPDGRHAVSASRDNTLRVWDLAPLGHELAPDRSPARFEHVRHVSVTEQTFHASTSIKQQKVLSPKEPLAEF